MDTNVTRRSTRNANEQDKKIAEVPGLKSLISEAFMSQADAEVWVFSVIEVLRAWKKDCVDNVQSRTTILAHIGGDRSKWTGIAATIAKMCVDPKLAVADSQQLDPITRSAQAASLIIIYGTPSGNLEGETFHLAWRHKCAVRLLFAIIADYQDNALGFFAETLGLPKPGMYYARPDARHGGRKRPQSSGKNGYGAFEGDDSMDDEYDPEMTASRENSEQEEASLFDGIKQDAGTTKSSKGRKKAPTTTVREPSLSPDDIPARSPTPEGRAPPPDPEELGDTVQELRDQLRRLRVTYNAACKYWSSRNTQQQTEKEGWKMESTDLRERFASVRPFMEDKGIVQAYNKLNGEKAKAAKTHAKLDMAHAELALMKARAEEAEARNATIQKELNVAKTKAAEPEFDQKQAELDLTKTHLRMANDKFNIFLRAQAENQTKGEDPIGTLNSMITKLQSELDELKLSSTATISKLEHQLKEQEALNGKSEDETS